MKECDKMSLEKGYITFQKNYKDLFPIEPELVILMQRNKQGGVIPHNSKITEQYYKTNEISRKNIEIYLVNYINTYFFNVHSWDFKETREKIIDSPELIKLINKEIIDETIKIPVLQKEIIYEQLIDENNNIYGKELVTEVILPIAKTKYIYTMMCHKIIETAYNGSTEYYIRFRKKIVLYHNNSKELKYSIYPNGIATEYDIEEYKKEYKSFIIGNYKRGKLKEYLKAISRSNVYQYEFIQKQTEKQQQKPKILLEPDNISKHMEIIEYSLLKLKQRNIELYQTAKKQYDNILTKEIITIQSLASLEGKIEFYLYFNKINLDNILKSLEEKKNEYLNNFTNNNQEKTKLTIKDLDKINEFFLMMSNNYNPVERRKVLKNISVLYILEIFKNKDTITPEDLNNSYFRINLKSIIICIEELKNEGYIEIDNLIYNHLEEEISIDSVLDIIKKITINKTEPKKLVKEIQN